ncbi:MAG: hypothetical protein AAFQ07_04340 [Chloroflexota bacterium]
MMAKRPFFDFGAEADKVWQKLWERQYPECVKYAHPIWLEGLKKLGITGDGLPDFDKLDKIFQDEIGWELVSTDVQYSDGQDWFVNLAEKKFLITEYIREMKDLDYTPLPDIWHDAFGHLPWMTHQPYADYVRDFAIKSIEFTPEKRKPFGSLWWYSIEFGLMKHEGETKAFGAGLMSGYAEMQRVMAGTVKQTPFTLARMETIDPSPHEYHDEMFVFDDFAHMSQASEQWYAHHQDLRIVT